MRIAQLRHNGGYDAAPQALPHLQQMLSRETGLALGTDRRDVSIADTELFHYPVVFMHGRNSFHLSPADATICGNMWSAAAWSWPTAFGKSQFTASFRDEMAAIFPGKPLVKIPANDPIFTTRYGGFELKTVKRRDPSRGDGERPSGRQHSRSEPELDAIKIEDRYGVIFSPYDLSCAGAARGARLSGLSARRRREDRHQRRLVRGARVKRATCLALVVSLAGDCIGCGDRSDTTPADTSPPSIAATESAEASFAQQVAEVAAGRAKTIEISRA